MQRAKTTLKLSVLAALLVHCVFAEAQAPIPVGQDTSIALAAPSVPDSKPAVGPFGSTAKALAIGKGDDAAPAAGSLRELENLQREAFLGDLRAKIRAQNATSKGETNPSIGTPVAATATAAPTSLTQIFPSQFAPPTMAPPAFPIYQQSAMGAAYLPGAPTAQLVSVIVSSTRTRADVIEDGLVKTVKEGDKLGDWSVTSITTNGVLVERANPLLQQVSQPVVYKANGMAKKATAKRMKFIVPAIPYEKTMSVLLKPYRPPEVAAAAVVNGVVAPVIPPLPAAIRPADSTSIAPAAAISAGK